MTHTPAAAGYMFDNALHDARRRLDLLEATYDPLTLRHLATVGVEPGWRCAELGAGGGSIARWLCSRVGPGGRVVAVDLDTRFLEESGEPNLEVRQADLTASDLEPGAYDLVHARALLVHLPSRTDLLERMVTWLRPGGRLLVEEPDFYPITAVETGAYREAFSAMAEVVAAGGGASDWARDLPGLLDALGLKEVDADTTVMTFRGGSACARMIGTTILQVRAAMVGSGRIGEDDLDGVVAELDRPERWFTGFAGVAAWGRR